MYDYKVSYKTDADDDGREWRLGPHPNADYALAIFNSVYAGPEGLGQFTFEETGPYSSEYVLYERASGFGPEQGFMIWPT